MFPLSSFVLLIVTSLQGPAKHPVVCGKGVRTYGSLKEVPTPFDTLKLPPHAPIQVHSQEEAEAAQAAIMADAGKIGATGLVVEEVSGNDGGSMSVHRRVVPVFVPADTARAYAACRS
jgi:hypothetical protein